MRWMEITIETCSEAADALTEMLAQLGADGISICDPEEIEILLKNPDSLSYADDGFYETLGKDTTIKAYFAEFDDGIRLGAKEEEYNNPAGVGLIYGKIAGSVYDKETVIKIIEERIEAIREFLPVGKGLVSQIYVEEQDWANNWKKYYKVVKISPHVVISPSWESYIGQEDEIVISLDPGSAFGTGTHETTAMCIRFMDKLFSGDIKTVPGFSGDKILDVGCGSGILSITADKLGAKYIEAIDVDRLAVQVAEDNCAKNESKTDCHTGELKNAKRNDYTLIVANIVAEVISLITPQIPDYLVQGGLYLVSGIIDQKKESVLSACGQHGFKIVDSMTENDWWAYLFQKI